MSEVSAQGAVSYYGTDTLAGAWVRGPDALYTLADKLWAERNTLRKRVLELEQKLEIQSGVVDAARKLANQGLKAETMQGLAYLNDLYVALDHLDAVHGTRAN